jgi:hypothetical protein
MTPSRCPRRARPVMPVGTIAALAPWVPRAPWAAAWRVRSASPASEPKAWRARSGLPPASSRGSQAGSPAGAPASLSVAGAHPSTQGRRRVRERPRAPEVARARVVRRAPGSRSLPARLLGARRPIARRPARSAASPFASDRSGGASAALRYRRSRRPRCVAAELPPASRWWRASSRLASPSAQRMFRVGRGREAAAPPSNGPASRCR